MNSKSMKKVKVTLMYLIVLTSIIFAGITYCSADTIGTPSLCESGYDVYAPSVMYDSQENIWKMWYGGWMSQSDIPYDRVYYCTSNDGVTWGTPQQVVYSNTVQINDPTVVKVWNSIAGRYQYTMFFTWFDSSRWTSYSQWDSRRWMNEVGLTTSWDGINWGTPQKVIGAWNGIDWDGAWAPSVIAGDADGSYYWLYYHTWKGDAVYRSKMTNGGATLVSTERVTFDNPNIQHANVDVSKDRNGKWWMFYNRINSSGNYEVAKMISQDGLAFTDASGDNPVITDNSIYFCTPNVVWTGTNSYDLYYGKGVHTLARDDLSVWKVSATYSLPAIAAPGSFSLSYPASGATGLSDLPSFSWSESSNASWYELVVADNSNFSNPVIDVSTIGKLYYTSYTKLTPGTTYYWKVVAHNGGSNTVSTGSGRSFTVSAMTSAPRSSVLASSTSSTDFNAANIIDGNTGTAWSSAGHTDFGNNTEWLQLDMGANYNISRIRIKPRTSGQGFPVGFKLEYKVDGGSTWATVPCTNYHNYPNPGNNEVTFNLFWNINARYIRWTATELGQDTYENWYMQGAEIYADQGTSSYTLAPGSFKLVSPDNGANPVGSEDASDWRESFGKVILDWEDSFAAESYTVQIASDSGFSNIVHQTNGIEQSKYTVPLNILKSNTTYYWKVTAVNRNGSTNCSNSSYSFKTGSCLGVAIASLTSSSQLTGTEKEKVLDNNPYSYWSSNIHTGASYTEWIYADLGQSYTGIRQVRLTPRAGGYCFPVDFKLQYSSDAQTWYDIPGQNYTGFANPASMEQNFTFNRPITARYIRVYATKLSSDGSNYYLQFSEIGIGRLVGYTPLSCIGGSASSTAGSGWAAQNAWDGTTACWSSTSYLDNAHTEWLSINTGSANNIIRVRLKPRYGGYSFPVGFKIQYSTNGTNWTDVAGQSYTNYANPGSKEQVFTFANAVNAQYIRIYCTKLGTDGSAYYFQLDEIIAEGV